MTATPTVTPDLVAAHFPIGAVRAVSPVQSGLMHCTSMVEAERGRFILQRLHAKLDTPEILADYLAVTEHLAARGEVAPQVVAVDAHTPLWTDPMGGRWRLTTVVPGRTFDKVTTLEQAEQGARALGRFHRVMASIEHEFASQHPLHDTAGHLAGLEAVAADPQYAAERATIGHEIDEILVLLPAAMLPRSLPRRVVHGDPKISNVMFVDGVATGLIDLDTCNRHSVLVDLGDAVRSWCRDGAEDERQHFQLDRFEALLRGYAAAGLPLTAEEQAHLVGAGRLITLELASRFARDVLQDEYFAYDTARYPSRRAHNQARTRAMLFLAEDMRAREPEVRRLVQAIF